MNTEKLNKANLLQFKIGKLGDFISRKVAFGYGTHGFFKYKTNISEITEVFDAIEEVENVANLILTQKLNEIHTRLTKEFENL